jgi:O-succinylbenzoate synthase
MKIEQVRISHLRMKLQSPFETSFGSIETRDCLLIEIYSDGVVGYGECVADRDPGYSEETAGTAWHITEEFLLPLIFSQNDISPMDFHDLASGVRGNHLAKAGIEMALWDLYGKQEGRSLRDLLGGEQTEVQVGVSIGIQSDPQKLLESAYAYLEDGYKRIKIKIKPGRDVVDTQTMRDTFPDLPLQVDANSAYTLENYSTLKPLDEMGLLLIEQPLAEDDIWDHHFMQAEFKTPICLDESIHSLRHARQALEMKATQVINIKAGRVGGISQGVAIHDYCFQQGVPVWCGGMLETGVGRASNLALASLPNFVLPGDISATERYYENDITNERFTLNSNSTITVPDKPGLGITIDRTEVKKVSLRTEMFKN